MSCGRIWPLVGNDNSEEPMKQTEFFIKATDPKILTVAQLMQDAVTRCTEDQTLAQVADLFQDRYLTRVPVVRTTSW